MRIPELIENEKKYFGTYAVMAMLNAQTVLDHIQKTADIEASATGCFKYKDREKSECKDRKPNEENLWEHPVMLYLCTAAYGNVIHPEKIVCTAPKGKDQSEKVMCTVTNDKAIQPEKVVYVTKKLQEYFPFLKIMGENQREHWNKKNNENRLEVNAKDLYDVLNKMFRVLKTYRDLTTHSVIKDNRLAEGGPFLTKSEQPLAIIINRYYEVVLRNVKEKYSYETEDLAFIQNHRYKRVFENGNRTMRLDTGFFFSMNAYNGDSENRLHISGVGVALLICLFLDKQYVNLFASRLPIFANYGPQSEKRRILLRSMGIHSVRLPKDRIRFEKDGTALAMDMLNELKKCPDELFDTLSAEDKSRFRIMSSDHDEVLMKRYSDRFAQLLLQYIDYGGLFKNIRFHVHMGKLRYLFNAEKNCIDGNTRVRVLEHPLNGFGRINEMEAIRKRENGTFADTGVEIRDFDNVKRDDANHDNYPYIIDAYSRYILENNKVEMSFCGGHTMPDIREKDGKWYVCKEIPECRMSTLELPAMAFHILLFGEDKTERCIKEVYDKYRRLFEAMADGKVSRDNIHEFGIAEFDLPKKVIDCLDGRACGKDADQFIAREVEALYADTERRMKRLDEDKVSVLSNDNKMGKKGFVQMRTGVIADFLAKDIVRLLPTNSEGMRKLTGLNYRVLQSAMATYDSAGEAEAKERFRQLFENARLLGADVNKFHPFIHKVFARNTPENIIDFYGSYLAERENYLNKLRKSIYKGKRVNVPFVNRDQRKWKDSEQEYLGKVYGEDLAIELPRQMFDSEIKEHLRTLPQMNGVDFERANVTYLIGEYLKRVMDDGSQEFYSWKRNYRYMDMLIKETDPKKGLHSMYTTVDERETLWKERENRSERYREWAKKRDRDMHDDMEERLDRMMAKARNEYQKGEKTIRRYKVQDALMFMLAKKTLTKDKEFDGEKFRLKDIAPDAEKGILSEIMHMTFTFTVKGSEKKYTITSENTKLKNYGDFFVLANDKRMPALLKLIDSDTVEKNMLTEELKNYDRCRPEMVELIFDLEKWAFDNYSILKEKIARDEKVQFRDILEELIYDDKVDEQQSEVLCLIRNAFEHNNYPPRRIVQITTLPEVAKNIKEIFGKYAMIK